MITFINNQPGPFNRSALATALPQKLETLINQHYLEQRNRDFYCRHLRIPKQKLDLMLKLNFGKTLHQLVAERLLSEAKILLHQDTHTVKQITYELGFSDMAQFCKFFKKHTGLKPSAYRSYNL